VPTSGCDKLKGAVKQQKIEAECRTEIQQGAEARPDATAATTAATPSTHAPTAPCGHTRTELYDLHVAHSGSPVWSRFFFKTAPPRHLQHLTVADDLPRCIDCGCTIHEHRLVDAAYVTGKRGTVTPEVLLDRIWTLRNGRPLNEILAQRGARFLASDPRFGTVGTFLYFHDADHDMVAQLRDIHACSTDGRRPVLMTTGIFGTGKTILLLRALDAIPPAGPTLDVARVYITFDFATGNALKPGGRYRFNAALLLRVFHAALTTLGPYVYFREFLDNADWAKFVDAAKYLPLLADALGVQTLAIAVDRITSGVRHQAPSGTDLEAQTVTQLCDLFKWADIKRVQQAAAPRGADDEAATPAVVIPILSCLYPRCARAAQRSDNDRPLLWLQAGLAPSLDEVANRVDPPSRPNLSARLLELSYRQQYASCGGHFRLCPAVCWTVAQAETSPERVRDRLKGAVDVLANQLTLKVPSEFATMVAQAVSGMTFTELQKRHGHDAAPLDAFFPSDSSAANLPLAVVLSPSVQSSMRSFRDVSPMTKAFEQWTEAADDALQQASSEGMRKAFEAMVVHGMALRWAAFLALTPPTLTQPTPPAPPPSVGFCAGRGAYLDPAGTLCWIELSNVAVCEPCTYQFVTGRLAFPPPGGTKRATYALTAASVTHPVIEDGGSVAVSSLPRPFESSGHVYFTVRSHKFASDAGGLERLVQTLPSDAPCIHLLWTPRPYTPEPSIVDALLRKLRSSRGGGGAAAVGPPLDIVAFVNVQDCLTPSLAWTLTCAGF
jgi:hypothetical protein